MQAFDYCCESLVNTHTPYKCIEEIADDNFMGMAVQRMTIIWFHQTLTQFTDVYLRPLPDIGKFAYTSIIWKQTIPWKSRAWACLCICTECGIPHKAKYAWLCKIPYKAKFEIAYINHPMSWLSDLHIAVVMLYVYVIRMQ